MAELVIIDGSVMDERMEESDKVPRGERIAKALARAGVGSRRDVERMIAAGRVAIDGRILTSPAILVTSLAGIEVDGEGVGVAQTSRLWRYHKRRGLLCTSRDPQGRPTIFDELPAGLPRVLSVGRLDLNSEGLLLLTNDGELARWLELPSTGWTRRYRVRAHGPIDEARLDTLRRGGEIDGVHYAPTRIEVERTGASNHWFTMTLTEGKNREIRKLLQSVDLRVNRLIRVGYGPFTLGTLDIGRLGEVPAARMQALLGAYFTARPAKEGLVAPRHDRSKWAKAKPKSAAGVGTRARKAKSRKTARAPSRPTLRLKP